ncbi:O-antigen ligase family protein [Candidatus Leptofilum sp.]|uniref:O-antigen ligase family protein n=1 Tax=Candidatus Leptofilum sp. TaxID=3241576 RepID=UPI003B59CFA2
MQQREIVDHPLRKWQETIWLLLAFLTPLFVNLWVEQQFEASKIWLLRTLIWLLVLLWFAGWMTNLRPKSLPTPLKTLIVILILILALSTAFSTNHFIAIFGTLDRANGVLTQISYFLLFICVATHIDATSSRRLLQVAIVTAVPITLFGLAQAAGWQPLPVITDARSDIITTLGRANFTGAYLALLLPLTFAAAQSTTNKLQQFGYGSLILLELIVIAFTQARAAWIAAIVGIGLLWWFQVAPRWPAKARWLSALAGIATLGTTLLLILQRGIANGGSIAARWTIWQASLRLLWPRLWLGYGADTLELHFPSVYPPQLVYYQGRGVVVDRAHNWLLDWLLNYGIVATLFFIILIFLVLRLGWRQLAEPKDGISQQLEVLPNRWVAACMAAACAQLVGNLFLFEVAATAVLFWLLLGIITATSLSPDLQTVPFALPHRARQVAVVLGCLLFSWAVWQSNLRPLLADSYSWRGTQALSQGNPSAALIAYETAVHHQPHRAPYHVAAALTAAQVGNFVQAEAAMAEAIALRPTDPVLYTQLAAIYAQEATVAPEKTDLAYGAYEQAIALAPTIGLTHQQFADLALRIGDEATAPQQAQQAVDLDATDGMAYGILGWAHSQSGDLAAAQTAFEQAVKWQPNLADFHLGLATVYAQQGDFAAAREALQHSLALDAAYAPALALQLQMQEK